MGIAKAVVSVELKPSNGFKVVTRIPQSDGSMKSTEFDVLLFQIALSYLKMIGQFMKLEFDLVESDPCQSRMVWHGY